MNFFFLSTNLPSASISEAVNAIEANVLILGVTNLKDLKNPLPEYIEELLAHTKNLCEIWVVGSNDLTRELSLRSKKVRVFSSFKDVDQVMESME